MKDLWTGAAVFAFIFVVLSGTMSAQQTGEIHGKITDEAGEALPGVTVTAKSPALQGLRAAVSDKSGGFWLPLLPVGTYALTFELAGFEKLTMTGNEIRLGLLSSLSVILRPSAVKAEVIVVAANPLIDKTKADTSYRLSSDDLALAPTQARTIAETVNLTPGVTGVRTNTVTGGANANWIADLTTETGLPNFRGEGNGANNWFVDGLSTKGVAFNDPGVRLNYDAWEEVQIISDGFAPELGQSVGGFINIVTKSGSNSLHGQLGGLIQGAGLRAKRKEQMAAGSVPETTQQQYFANLGGPIVKDRLWFFVSDNLFANSDRTSEQVIGWLTVPGGSRRTSTNNVFGKITLTPHMNHTLSLSGTFDDLLHYAGGIGTPESYVNTTYNRYSYRLNYRGIFSRNTLLTAAWGQNRNENSIQPVSGDFGPAAYYWQDIGQVTHGASFTNHTLETRTDLAVGLAQYLDLGRWGNHEIKVGGSYYGYDNRESWRWTGSDNDIARGDGFDNGVGIAWIGQGIPALLWENAPGDAKNTSHGFGLYAEDNIVRGRFSLMIGLRTDTQQVFNDVGVKAWSWGIGDFLQPRATMAWDLAGDGRSVFKLGYGRYSMPIAASSLPFVNTVHLFIHRFYRWIGELPLAPAEYDTQVQDPANWTYFWDQAGIREVDPTLKPNKMNRFLMEFDRQFGMNWVFKLRGIYSYAHNLIDNITVYDPDTPNKIKYLLTNFELKRRNYRALEVEINGRIPGRLALNAAWTWSQAKGTTPGDFFESIGWDIFAGGYYDNTYFGMHPLIPDGVQPWKAYYDFLFTGMGGRGIGDEGWYGVLPYSVDHVVKILATYFAPYGLNVSTDIEYLSGYHWEKKALTGAGFYSAFPEGRGGRTTPPHTYVDIAIQKDLPLRRGLMLGLGINAYNVFNSQRPVSYFKNDNARFGQVWARQLPRWVQLKFSLRF